MGNELLEEYEAGVARASRTIHTVKEGGLDAADLPDSLKQLAADNGFNGEAGAVLANKDGVLLGLGDGRDPFIAAAAADKLPKGDYSFAAWLNEDEAPLACLGWLMGGYRFDRYK
ncbi:hypothetical protein MNBD_ALPHA05-1589, partial [hydrothermal vent metagenome]